MKIGCFGDVHITDKRPKNRTDKDYLNSLYRKIEWARVEPLKECEYIIMPGDIFDSFKASDFLKQFAIPLFLKMKVLAIYGQHDLRFHNSNKMNTPLRVLEVAKAVTVLNGKPLEVCPGVEIYGCNWGEEIPKIVDPEALNILVIHLMVIKDEKLWSAQEGHSMAKILLRTSGFDLIISGDNHQRFTSNYKDKALINMGSLMRSKIDQVDHKPAVAVFDTETKKVEVIDIPVKPINEIFRIEEAQKEADRSEQLESFIEGLESTEEIEGLDFKANVEEWIKDNKEEQDPEIIKIMEEALEWKKSSKKSNL